MLVTALRLETRAVLAALARVRRVRPARRPTWTGFVGAREITVVQGGVGPIAANAAAAAIPEGAGLVGSVGFAGALAPTLSPGDVVIPAAIVWLEDGGGRYDVSPAVCDALSGALHPGMPGAACGGTLLSSASILAGVVAKRIAFERHAAVAVEMEAAALARWARARGVPFFALRVVLDPAALSLEDLPPNLDSSWTARARLATLPRAWPLLATLRRHAATAGLALTRALGAALPALPLAGRRAPLAPFGSGPYSAPADRTVEGWTMRFPAHITTDMLKWQAKNWLHGVKRYPFVLMLEPLHTCNLACLGCSPERYNGDLKDRLSLDECFQAVDESGAPVVSICGGEPTIYPEITELIDGIIARKRHIYLCTNGILLDRFFKKAKPQDRLSINVHLDGMAKTHDFVVDRPGVFDKAIEMIKLGKSLGYRVCTNTTIFRETDMDEIEEMLGYLDSLGVDGMLLSPGLPLRGPSREALPLPPRGERQVQARPGAVEEVPVLFDAALPRVRGRPARLPVHALGQRHADTGRLEGPLLSRGREVLPDLGGVLERRRLGLLGIAAGSSLPELPHAQRLRGLGRAEAAARVGGTYGRWRNGASAELILRWRARERPPANLRQSRPLRDTGGTSADAPWHSNHRTRQHRRRLRPRHDRCSIPRQDETMAPPLSLANSLYVVYREASRSPWIVSALRERGGNEPEPPSTCEDGDPVMILGGFLSHPFYYAPLARVLRGAGHAVHFDGAVNARPFKPHIAELRARVQTIVDQSGVPLRIVGHSLGGIQALALLIAAPECISQVVAVASPVVGGTPWRPLQRLAERVLRVRAHEMQLLQRSLATYASRVTTISSRYDMIAPPETCGVEGAADVVLDEVPHPERAFASHGGVVFMRTAMRAVVHALAGAAPSVAASA